MASVPAQSLPATLVVTSKTNEAFKWLEETFGFKDGFNYVHNKIGAKNSSLIVNYISCEYL